MAVGVAVVTIMDAEVWVDVIDVAPWLIVALWGVVAVAVLGIFREPALAALRRLWSALAAVPHLRDIRKFQNPRRRP